MKQLAVLTAIVLLFIGPFAGPAFGSPSAGPPQTGPLQLQLTQVTPRVITTDSPPDIVVTGTLRNTGNVPIEGLQIRLQRGEPLRTEGELRNALDARDAADAVNPNFTDIPGDLAPGAEIPVELTVPLRGSPAAGLALSRTGVYELLVNVNGVPQGGVRARLAAVRMLLPVLGLPASGSAAPVADAPPAAPVPVTLLYPIADTPRRLPTVPGEPALLTDDELAASFAPDGRLGGLVSALAGGAPPGSPARNATCVAIDPDLVQTAAAMREGYQVRGPDGVPVPGNGAEAAARWLDDLAAATRGGCVIALPYADADLVALTQGGLGAQARSALTEGRQILAQLLGTTVLDAMTWPADGVLDDATLAEVARAGGRAVVLAGDAVEGPQRRGGVLPVGGAAGSQLAVLSDPLLTRAAGGPDPASNARRGIGAAASQAAAGTAGPLSTQDLIGALAYRVRFGPSDSAPLVVAPPHQWAAEGTGARALLDTVNTLASGNLVQPRALGAVLASARPAGTAPRRVAAPLPDGADTTPPTVVAEIRDMLDRLADLESAAVEAPGVGATPDAVFAPLRQAVLRPASAAWHGKDELAERQTRLAAARVGELRAAVRVLEPPSPFSLGTRTAPLLLTVANGLPVTMRVQLDLTSTTGLRVVDPIPEVTVPPLGRRQVEVATEVLRSGRFGVVAVVRTPEGGLLGPPSRLQVRSTAYGTITVWLTGSAGVLLVVLAARRVLRRIRGEPDGARRATRRPTPGPPRPKAPRPDTRPGPDTSRRLVRVPPETRRP